MHILKVYRRSRCAVVGDAALKYRWSNSGWKGSLEVIHSPHKAGLMAKGLICFWHSRECSSRGWCIPVTGDYRQAARET